MAIDETITDLWGEPIKEPFALVLVSRSDPPSAPQYVSARLLDNSVSSELCQAAAEPKDEVFGKKRSPIAHPFLWVLTGAFFAVGVILLCVVGAVLFAKYF